MYTNILYVLPHNLREIKKNKNKQSVDPISKHYIDIIKENASYGQYYASADRPPKTEYFEIASRIYSHIYEIEIRGDTSDLAVERISNNEVSIQTNARRTTYNDEQANGSVIQKLNGSKKSLLRGYIMGRRTTGIGRGVIGNAPKADLETVVIPMAMAEKMTQQIEITDLNMSFVEKLFRNTESNVYPMITKIMYRKGPSYATKQITSKDIATHRALLVKGNIVCTNLLDGTPVIMNRQPSLLPSNMTAMKVHVDRDPSIQNITFNVSNAKNFNADFDGDQMNTGVLDSKSGQREAFMLASSNRWAVSGQNSTAFIGHTYDAVIGMWLTTQEHAYVNAKDLLFCLMHVKNVPNLLSTAKGLIKKYGNKIHASKLLSMVIPKCVNIDDKPESYVESHPELYSEWDKRIVIKDGVIERGVIDARIIAVDNTNSMHRSIAYEYGPSAMLDTIFNMQQISQEFSLHSGFTVGIRDVIVPSLKVQALKHAHVAEVHKSLSELFTSLVDGKLAPPTGTSASEWFVKLATDAMTRPK